MDGGKTARMLSTMSDAIAVATVEIAVANTGAIVFWHAHERTFIVAGFLMVVCTGLPSSGVMAVRGAKGDLCRSVQEID